MPPASRVTDFHVCPKCDPVPHLGGPVNKRAGTVKIGNQYAARVDDTLDCIGVPCSTDTISSGEDKVLIEGEKAARVGSTTRHGGFLLTGCQSVTVGSTNHGASLRAARPFGERCRVPEGPDRT